MKAGIIKADGSYIDRITGTPQGGVISPLLANIFLHIAFDKWIEKEFPNKPFERYADDIVVHCKTDKQARFVLSQISKRLSGCKLSVHPAKTKIINLRGITDKKFPRGLDFLGFTLRPAWSMTSKGFRLLPTTFMSRKSMTSVLEKFRQLKIHKWRKSIEELAEALNPIIRGVINYYCKFYSNHTLYVWKQINKRLLKWVQWEKGLYKLKAIRWLKTKYREKPKLFYHWQLVHP